MTKITTLPDGTIIEVHASIHDDSVFEADNHHESPNFWKYSESQARDSHGRWSGGGGGADSGAKGTTTRTAADATLQHGGSTTDIRTGKAITSGMAVSVNPELTRTYAGAKGGMNGPAVAAAASRFITANHGLLTDGKHAFGTWLDGHDLHFDVITIVHSPAQADSLARQHNQIAYFNIDTGTEVNTGGTGQHIAKRYRGWVGRTLDFLFDRPVRPGPGLDPLGLDGHAAVLPGRRDDGPGRAGPEGRGRSDGSVGEGLNPAASSAELIVGGVEAPVTSAPLDVAMSPRQQAILAAIQKYSESEARDAHGEWTSGGGSEGEKVTLHRAQPKAARESSRYRVHYGIKDIGHVRGYDQGRSNQLIWHSHGRTGEHLGQHDSRAEAVKSVVRRYTGQ